MSIKVGITGGGSAGHVVPALAVAAELRRLGVDELVFFGRAGSVEQELAEKAGIRFSVVPSAGLRRYRSWRNLIMPFTVIKGVFAAAGAVRREHLDVLFSKGSFVSVPVGIGAWMNRVPFAIHESDHSLGLANRILARFARKVLLSAPAKGKTAKFAKKSVVTGLPLRDDLAQGQPERLRRKLGIRPGAPVLLIFCGSSGSVRINKAIRARLRELLRHFAVVHVVGKGNLDNSLRGIPGYWQVEYLHDDMVDALWLADLVIGRSGATTLAELGALRKPAVLIPLPTTVSRGDQVVNAEEFARRNGNCVVLTDDESLADGQPIVDACAQLAPALRASRGAPPVAADIRRNANNIARQVLSLTPKFARREERRREQQGARDQHGQRDDRQSPREQHRYLKSERT